MGDHEMAPEHEPTEHSREDSESPEDDELSIEELEEAAGGIGEYEPPAPNAAC